MNALTGKVQVHGFKPRVVWYRPLGFPDVVTDADLVEIQANGQLVLDKGWETITISAAQVKMITSSRAAGWLEMRDEERAEYDQVSRGGFSAP